MSPQTRAIVVGYGRFGQTVAQMLMAKRIPLTIIDSKASQIELSGEFGTKVYYGDGIRLDLLRTAGAETADAILFCQDGREIDRSKIESVLEAFPQAQVMVRVFDRRQLMDLAGLDISLLQRELFESAVTMGRDALVKLGFSERDVERVEREYRQMDSERLAAQKESGDIYAAKDRMFGTDRPLADEAKGPA